MNEKDKPVYLGVKGVTILQTGDRVFYGNSNEGTFAKAEVIKPYDGQELIIRLLEDYNSKSKLTDSSSKGDELTVKGYEVFWDRNTPIDGNRLEKLTRSLLSIP